MIKNIVTGTTGNYENELKKLRLAFERYKTALQLPYLPYIGLVLPYLIKI